MTNLLIVCTANRCRSPIGEGLMKRELADADVSSAGFLPSGSPAEAEAVSAMKEIGIDISEHRSRKLSPYLIDEADVVLVMERAHVRDIAVNFKGFPKTFTIKEFVRRAQDKPRNNGEALGDWIARLHEGRKASELLGADANDDVSDPIGKPIDAFRATRDELEDLTKKAATGLR